MDNIRLVYITCETREEALALSRQMVEARLAACTNVLGPMTATFRWAGKIETAEEVVLIAKTASAKVKALTDWVKANHSYDVPCALSLPVNSAESGEDYLTWLRAEVEPTQK